MWGRRHPYVNLSFLGIFAFTAPYLPWVLLAFSVTLRSNALVDLLGIVAGARMQACLHAAGHPGGMAWSSVPSRSFGPLQPSHLLLPLWQKYSTKRRWHAALLSSLSHDLLRCAQHQAATDDQADMLVRSDVWRRQERALQREQWC